MKYCNTAILFIIFCFAACGQKTDVINETLSNYLVKDSIDNSKHISKEISTQKNRFEINGNWINTDLRKYILNESSTTNGNLVPLIYVTIKNRKPFYWYQIYNEKLFDKIKPHPSLSLVQMNDSTYCSSNDTYILLTDSFLKIKVVNDSMRTFARYCKVDCLNVTPILNTTFFDYRRIQKIIIYETGNDNTPSLECKCEKSKNSNYILCSTNKFNFKYQVNFKYPVYNEHSEIGSIIEGNGGYFISVVESNGKIEDFDVIKQTNKVTLNERTTGQHWRYIFLMNQ